MACTANVSMEKSHLCPRAVKQAAAVMGPEVLPPPKQVTGAWYPCAVDPEWKSGLATSTSDPTTGEASFHASWLGGESRRRPSDSKSTSTGSKSARALATTNTRLRRWATPKYWASKVRHATDLRVPYTQPACDHRCPGGCNALRSPAIAPRKHPKALPASLRTPGTFSQTRMVSGS